MKGNLRNLLFSLSSCLIINLCLIDNANADSQYPIQATYNDATLTSDNSWHFLIAPYLWGTGLNGNINVHGFSNNFSLSFNDIWENLDFAGEVHIEANNGPWTLMVDPTYIKLTATNNVRNVSINLTNQTVLVDGGVFYNMFTNPLSYNQSTSLELLAGARYLGLENSVGITATSPIPALNFHTSTSDTSEMLAPIVGARFIYNANAVSRFWLRGDVGGFGVDNVSNTWSATLGYAYSFSPNAEVGIAYRVLRINFTKNNSSMDTLFYGPQLGIGFHF